MHRLSNLLTIGLLSLLSLACSAKTNFNNVGQEMVLILQNGHYAKLSFDDDMSMRILTDYIEKLDPQKLYFTQSDIDEFNDNYKTQLDNLLVKAEGTTPAKEIFAIFLERLDERHQYNQELLEKKEFNFTLDDSIQLNRKDAAWPQNNEDSRALWKLHLKESLLSELLRRESITDRANELNKTASDYLDEDESVYEKIAKRNERISQTYHDFDEEDVANLFLSTVAAAYDPHSDYFSHRETEQFRSSIANSLVGIGALLSSEDDGSTLIKGIVIGGPADKQGELQLNDRIVAVDPLSNGKMVDILYMPIGKVVSHIRGKKNTNVTLKVEPANGAPGQTKLIKIKRDVVEQQDEMASAEVYEYKSDNDTSKKLGWMVIPSFYKDFQNNTTSVARDVKTLLERMNQEDVDGLVIDLRNNGGGSLDEVQHITGYFTGNGPVVQIQDSLSQTRVKNSYSKNVLFTKPVTVLVSKTSASASEILAAALQDYNRAVVIGDEFTFGKGTVQQPLEIKRFMKWYQDSSRAGIVKATIQKFYRVSGGSTQLKGVESDIVIPSLLSSLEIGERYSKHALPYDEINPSTYNKLNKEDLHLSQLEQLSASRISSDLDFTYIKEEIERTKKRIEENSISLNINERREEIKKAEERRKDRIKEQVERYASIQQADLDSFSVYRMLLEDATSESDLPLLDRDEQVYMRTAKEELADLDTTPEYPSNLDPTKREALSILKDLITLSN